MLQRETSFRLVTAHVWRGRTLSYLLRIVRDVKPGLLLARIRRGDITNVDFDDLVRLVEALGFREVGGRASHRLWNEDTVAELRSSPRAGSQ